MGTKTERKRRRQQERQRALPVWTRAVRRIPLMRIGIVAGVVAITALGILLILRVSGQDAASIVPVPAAAGSSQASVGIYHGQIAPNFEAVALNGKRLRLSDLRGKVVLLNFYASWCTGCLAEIPGIQRVWDKYRDKGFTVLGVNDGESRSTAASFLRAAGGQYDSVVDPTQVIVNKYRVSGLPVSVLIGRDGVVSYYAPGELSASSFDQIVGQAIAGSTGAAAPAPVSTPASR